MSATVESLISEMAERLVREFDPLKIVLFGSHARGEAGPHSDLDLLVVMPDGVDRRRESVAMLRALADLPVAKDVIVTTPDEIARRGDLVGTVLRPALREGVQRERGVITRRLAEIAARVNLPPDAPRPEDFIRQDRDGR